MDWRAPWATRVRTWPRSRRGDDDDRHAGAGASCGGDGRDLDRCRRQHRGCRLHRARGGPCCSTSELGRRARCGDRPGFLLCRGLLALTYFPVVGEIWRSGILSHNVVMLVIVGLAGWLTLRRSTSPASGSYCYVTIRRQLCCRRLSRLSPKKGRRLFGARDACPYTGRVDRVARALRREQAARRALMTPTERVALAARLGEEAIASYMDAHAVDRYTAIEQLRASRRLLAAVVPWSCGRR